MIKEIKPNKKIKGIVFYTTDDLVEILGLSKLTIRRYLGTGVIPGAVKIGRRYYISNNNLNRWLGKGPIFQKPEKYIIDFINKVIKEKIETILEEKKII